MTHPRLAGLATPGSPGVASPLALPLAARIQERPWETFLVDPTSLANGCRDLVDAVSPDVIVATSVSVLTTGIADRLLDDVAHWSAALEAVGRLAASLTTRAAVGVHLPAPSALIAAGRDRERALGEITEAGRAALDAGAHLIVVEQTDVEPEGELTTLSNVASFHQAFVVSSGGGFAGLPGSRRVPLGAPEPGSGVMLTDHELERHTDVSVLSDWVYEVAG